MWFVQRTFRQTSTPPFYTFFSFVLNPFSIFSQNRIASMCTTREGCSHANYLHIHVHTINHLTSIITSDTPYLETASWLEASSRQIPPTVVPSSVWSLSPGGGDNTRRKLSDCLAKPKLLESILPIGMLLEAVSRTAGNLWLLLQILEARQITLPSNHRLTNVATKVPERWIYYVLPSLHYRIVGS